MIKVSILVKPKHISYTASYYLSRFIHNSLPVKSYIRIPKNLTVYLKIITFHSDNLYDFLCYFLI
jgi:hypothetical protein